MNRELGKPYQGFTLGYTDADAEALFVKKHGYKPDEVLRGKTIVRVGPIKEK